MGESHVNEQLLHGSWNYLDACWRKLDELRNHGQRHEEEVDRFASGWQLFIFEARAYTSHILIISQN
jgi:hypothetical protein